MHYRCGVTLARFGAPRCASGRAATPPGQARAELAVSDQAVRRGAVVIDKVMMEQDGFVVIHETSADSKPVAQADQLRPR
jgi:hypothetical protein